MQHLSALHIHAHDYGGFQSPKRLLSLASLSGEVESLTQSMNKSQRSEDSIVLTAHGIDTVGKCYASCYTCTLYII